jgi:hypothetical protein
MAKKVLITQSDYIPWKGYFDAVNMADVLVLYDEMQYTKRDWRNRNKIKTPNGTQWLTIPVHVKGKFFQKINATIVSDQKWRKKHWNTLIQFYKKARYFKEYKTIFEDLYNDESKLFLSEINRSFIENICTLLNINTPVFWSKEFDMDGDRNQKLLNICKDLKATHYISGPSAKSYMDVSLFEDEGIEIIWMDYSDYPQYPQLYGDFDHAVSVLDLLFNTGSDAFKYMKSFKKNGK